MKLEITEYEIKVLITALRMFHGESKDYREHADIVELSNKLMEFVNTTEDAP